MTDDELAAVDAWLDELETGCDGWYIEVRLVRALRDEVARLRAFAEEAASDHQHEWDAVDPQEVWYCTVCGEQAQDWTQYIHEAARALLNMKP